MKRLIILLLALLLALAPPRSVAQPIILTQPANQVVVNGGNVVFATAAAGPGPFTYQWQCNGTNLPNDLITTLAGNGNQGFSGDGGPATLAGLALPIGVAVDRSGNLFIGDNYNSRVRKVDVNGRITTVAGSGNDGYGGDGSLAIAASLSNPAGVATDMAGNLYIADSSNHRVRKVTPNGLISTVAGNGIESFSGDGGPAVSAGLYYPMGVAIDSAGNLFIADASNNRVRKVDTNGIITTVAGTGISDFAGDGGAATNADLHQPFGVAVDSAGNLFIVENSSDRVRKVDTHGIITTLAGNGFQGYGGDGAAATNSGLFEPYSVAVDGAGNCYVTDTFSDAIRKVDTNGIITTVAGGGLIAGDNISALNASLSMVEGVAADADGNVYVADTFNNRIRLIEHPGPWLRLNNVTTNNAGVYSVIISNASGSVTSSLASLTVVLPPGISGQPQSQSTVAGTSVDFTVVAGGTGPLAYQWQFNGTNLSGATNADYPIPLVLTNLAGNYTVTVTNAYGSVTSSPAILTVLPLEVTAPPQSQLVLAGSNITFSVQAAATPPAGYQWQFNGTNLDGATSTNYTIPLVTPDLAGAYAVVITNAYGSITSSPAMLTVLVAGITTPPASQSIISGSNVTFNLVAASIPPLGYQWQFNGTNLPGATAANFAINPVTTNNAGNYSVVLTNIYGSVTSSVAVLTVILLPPVITAQPGNQYATAGGNAAFQVTASGTPPLNYQWSFGGVPLAGQTNSLLTLSNLTTLQAGGYTVAVTSPFGSVTSRVAMLLVGVPPYITQQPTNQSVLAGTNVFVFVGVAGDGPLTFQWQLNGTNVNNISNLITRVAGNGNSHGPLGNGGAATNGELAYPCGVRADGAGNFYIVDQSDEMIRKVDAYGIITTVAGNGMGGYGGDGHSATNALLNLPADVAVDAAGNLFISDHNNNRLRRVSTNGIITTVAGNGAGIYSGDGLAATNASLNRPDGICFDASGNLYVVDAGNNRIRRIGTNGIITTVAGNGARTNSGDFGPATGAGLSTPARVAVDVAGNLYFTESQANQVRKVDTNGIITTIAGNGAAGYTGDGGPATGASLNNPLGLDTDLLGNVYLADAYNNRIRKVDLAGIITTFAGSGLGNNRGDGGPAASAGLDFPYGLAFDPAGNLLVTESSINDNVVRKVTQSSPRLLLQAVNASNAGSYSVIITSPYGSVTSQVATLTVLLRPSFVVPLASQSAGLGSNATFSATVSGTAPLSFQWLVNGVPQPPQASPNWNVTNVQWSDAGSYQVVVTNNYGSVTSVVATLTVGVPPAITSPPTNQFALAGSKSLLSVGVTGTGPFSYQWQLNGTNLPPIITTVAGNGTLGYSGDGGLATNAKLNTPLAAVIDAGGNLLISDFGNNRIRKVDTNGTITTVAGTGVSAETGNGGPATSAGLYYIHGLAADAAGNFYVAEFNGGRVRKVGTNGIISVFAGGGGSLGEGILATSASLNGAQALALDPAGNLYIADYYWYRIREVGTNGLMTTAAGNPSAHQNGGFVGDGGRATNATFSAPQDIAADALGNFYIADEGNNRIRKVDTNGIINTVIGGGSGSSDGLPGTNTFLGSPSAVKSDHNNNLYVLTDGRVRKMDTNGVMTTVAGGGTSYPGDFSPATKAMFRYPIGLALDALNNLYIVDETAYRVLKVHFSGDPTLTLPNATLANAGTYTVVITSPFGSMVSSPASLTVAVPPNIQSVSFTNGQLYLTWNAVANLNYQLQYNLDLSGTNWTNLGGPINANNNSMTTTDLPGADSQRYYRVLLLP